MLLGTLLYEAAGIRDVTQLQQKATLRQGTHVHECVVMCR